MTAILTYEGYTLMERRQGGWRSIIDGESIDFDSAAQWKQFIDYKANGKGKKSGHRN